MTERPAFIPNISSRNGLVNIENFKFNWYPGFSIIQKQKSISDLHKSIRYKYPKFNILEISSKSEDSIGKKLSAFNLTFKYYDRFITVESAFQSSKVFKNGGPYKDLFYKSSLEAKKDLRIKNSGDLIYFQFFNQKWDLYPTTAFYDWIYINALSQEHNKEFSEYIKNFDCFTDIEFNPKKSFNCQARSVALFNYLRINNILSTALSSKESYLNIITEFNKKDKIIKNMKINNKLEQGVLL